MTVSSQIARNDYTGNGITTNFPVTFRFLADTHLQVLRTDQSTGVTTTLTLNALGADGYTVTGAGQPSGGTVRLNAAPSSTDTLAILRNMPFTQLIDYIANDAFPAESHETGLDERTMENQQVREGLSRAMVLPPQVTGVSTQLPSPEADSLLGWNSSANGMVNYSIAALATSIAYGDKQFQTFVGDGVTTLFPLLNNPGSLGNLDVSINGVTQVNGTDFTLSGYDLSFTVPPPNLAVVLARYDLAVPVGTGLASAIFYTPPSTGIFGTVQSFLNSLWTAGVNSGAALIRFLQGGTGAVARTAQAKLRERVTLADFGATGDGVTNDTAAYNTAVATGAKEIIIGAGTYIIYNLLSVQPGQTVRGVGNPVIKMKDALSPKPATLLNLNFPGSFADIAFVGLTIDGNRANNIDHGVPDGSGNQSSGWTGALDSLAKIANVTGLKFIDCTFRNSWGNGVLVDNCVDVLFLGCRFKDIRRVALAFQNGNCQHVRVLGCHFANTVVGGMVIDGGHDIVFAGNTATNCSDRQRFPAIGYSGTYPNVWPSTGGFNTASDPGYVSPAQPGDGSGFELTGSTVMPTPPIPAYNVTLTGNTADTCWVGVRAEGQNYGIAITGNTARNCEGDGIFLFSCQRASVTGNTCINNLIGIESQQGPGAPLPQRPRFNVFADNLCHGNTQYGILLGGEANSAINGNVLAANGSGAGFQGGLGFQQANGMDCQVNIVSGNQISNNNPLGIGFDGTTHTGNFITTNQLNGNTVDQIHRPSPGYPWSSNKVTNNAGAPSSNYGSATLVTGGTSVTVPHGLGFAPDNGRITVTPASDTGGKRWWFDTVDATNFVIRIDSSLGSNIIFAWSIAEDA